MSNTKRRKPASTRTSQQRPTPAGTQRKKLPIIPILGVAVVAVLVVTIVLSFGSTEDLPLEVGAPAVSGQSLSRFVDSATDSTVGSPTPEASGADWNGQLATITHDGRAKMVMFLAHWCSFCQAEVPVVQDWYENTTLPPDVDVVSVGTYIDEFRDNYPTSEWLESEGWTIPLILDDQSSSVGSAFGLDGTPYWVFIDTDGNVSTRLTGNLTAESLDAIAASLSNS
ncbi:TlpA family protein disulfide reductase [bacterium]|nr:TlpA family protein disulfide reductase [bacterium]